MARSQSFRLVVISQSYPPAFPRMVEAVASAIGPTLLLCGTGEAGQRGALSIESLPGYDKRSLAHRAWSWSRFLGHAVARAIRVPGHPLVMVVTNPPFLAHAALALRGLRGLRYVVVLWDLYPDHIVQLGWLPESSIPVQAWRMLNRYALGNAEAVITLGESMRAQVGEHLAPRDARHLQVIPNWADTEWIRPMDKATNPFAIAHQQVGRMTVLYSGNMGATHGLTRVVDAAERLSNDDSIHFVFVGDGLGKRPLQDQVARLGLKNVSMLDPVGASDLPHVLATGDLALIAQAPGTERMSVPSKTYSALAAGSGLLALTRSDSDLGRLVTSEQVGEVFEQGSAAQLAQLIANMTRSPERLSGMRRRARRLAETSFSAPVAHSAFTSLLSPLISRFA